MNKMNIYKEEKLPNGNTSVTCNCCGCLPSLVLITLAVIGALYLMGIMH